MSTSVVMHRIDLLRDLNGRLAGLLDNPQPGLFVWMRMVAQTTDEIAAVMAGKRDQ